MLVVLDTFNFSGENIVATQHMLGEWKDYQKENYKKFIIIRNIRRQIVKKNQKGPFTRQDFGTNNFYSIQSRHI